VGDPWQRHGLASQLTDLCLEVARQWKITDLVAETTADNIPAREVLRANKFHEEVGDDGVVIARRMIVGG
jgi:predicted acetyltransferase